MGEIVYLNGSLVPIESAFISINDRGFLYGDGVFETLPAYKKIPFRLNAHIERLYKSLKDLKINFSMSPEELRKAVFQVIRANDYDDAVVRITVTRGNSKRRNLNEDILTPNIIIKVSKYLPQPQNLYNQGVDTVIVEDIRGVYCNYKSLNFLPNIIAKESATANGAFEAIMVTRRGFVTEGATSNVFAVIDNIIITPPADKKVLDGTTRRAVIELAKGLEKRVEEDALIKQDLFAAGEIFLTSSLMGIMPVTKINKTPVGDGQVGSVTNQLQQTYRRFVDSWIEKVLASN